MMTSKSQAWGEAPIVCCMDKTAEIAKKLATKITSGALICLYGDLGSGKTTFSKSFISAFGIKDFSIKSPTYTYIRNYRTNDHNIYHIDLYRLEEMDELLCHEIEEILAPENNIIVIEWADKMQGKLPKARIDIKFEYLDQNTRKITIDDKSRN